MRLAGLEPTASASARLRSIQLSYKRLIIKHACNCERLRTALWTGCLAIGGPIISPIYSGLMVSVPQEPCQLVSSAQAVVTSSEAIPHP